MSESQKSLQTLMKNMGLEVRSYSGRGMYRRECLGVVTVDTPMRLFINILENLPFYEDEANEYRDYINTVSSAFKGVLCDSLGMRNIIYFPDIEYVE